MRRLSAQRIAAMAADPVRRTGAVAIDAIDFARPFIHEEYTQLYYTPLYRRLSDAQRLTYNQLFGVRTNEFIMMLERDFVDCLLRPLRRHANVVRQADLAHCLDIMIEEEQRHYDLFLDLNRRAMPEVFINGRERFFSCLPWSAALTFRMLSLLVRRLAFPLWYFMAMEESSITLARTMYQRADTETLGPLEPHWVAVHREHAKDEARHLHIDSHLIEACIGRTGRMTRRVNARLFERMLRGGFTRPKRAGSGIKVIRQLVRLHPDLAPLERDLMRSVLDLGDHKAFRKSLFNREIMPLTFELFDATPELSALARHMVGYERH